MSTDLSRRTDDDAGGETFQISAEAAQVYETQFVPAIFAEWAPRLAAFTGIGPGDHVVDVGCGTGVVARHIASITNEEQVIGIDRNQAMLDVAAQVAPGITWQRGDAADLPLARDAVDIAVSQMAAMFFPDRLTAVAEMARVARRRVALLVPAGLADQPAYGVFTDVVRRHSGDVGASLVGAYWSAGDRNHLHDLFIHAGLGDITVETIIGTARFDSVDHLVSTEVEGSPLVDRIDQATYGAIRRDCRAELASFVTAGGRCHAPLVCHLIRGDHRNG